MSTYGDISRRRIDRHFRRTGRFLVVAGGLLLLARPADAVERHWVGGLVGWWDDMMNWASAEGGAGGAGIPTTGQDAFVGADVGDTNQVIYRIPAGAPVLDDVFVDGPGTPILLMSGTDELICDVFYAGFFDHGELDHSDGLLNVALLYVAHQSGSTGEMRLSNLGVVFAGSLGVGAAGDATFDQTGGTLITDRIDIGLSSSSSSSYALSSGSMTSQGSLVVGNGGTGTFHQTGGTASALNLTLGLQVIGDGLYQLQSGTLSTDITTVARGTFLQQGGEHDAAVQLNVIGAPGSPAQYTLEGGQLTAGAVFIVDQLDQAGGILQTASLTNMPGASVDVSGTAEFRVTDVTNDGTFFQSGGTVSGGFTGPPLNLYLIGTMTNTGAFTYSGGNFYDMLVNDGNISMSAPLEVGGGLVNNGNIEVGLGDTLSALSFGIVNHGEIVLFLGTLASPNAPVFNDGLLWGNGLVSDALDNAGVLAPGIGPIGSMTVNGPVTLLPLSTLEIEIDGYMPIGEHDQLIMGDGDPVALGGELDVQLGFQPAMGDSFVIIDSAGSFSGEFDTVSGGFGLVPTVGPGGLSLDILGARSDFEDGTLESWTYEGDVASMTVQPGGACGNYVQFFDAGTGPIMTAVAPAKFLGDWSSGDGLGYVSAMATVLATGGGQFSLQPRFIISGPGGTAHREFPYPPIGTWATMRVALDESEWIVDSGAWPALLADVTSLKIYVEYLNGADTIGLDEVTVSLTPDGAPADIDQDGQVAVTDLLALLAAWGTCPGCPEDLDGDGMVAVTDLLMLLAAWGPCP